MLSHAYNELEPFEQSCCDSPSEFAVGLEGSLLVSDFCMAKGAQLPIHVLDHLGRIMTAPGRLALTNSSAN